MGKDVNILMKRLLVFIFLFFLTSTAWGEFPTTAVLDNFNRASEGPPPGVSWSNTGWTAYGLDTYDNYCRNADYDNDAYATWTAATYGPDVECFITLASIDVTGEAQVFAITNMTDIDGYRVYTHIGDDILRLYRLDNGISTQLGSDYTVSGGLSSGDKIAIELTTTNVKAWYYDAGSVTWIEAVTFADTTYRSSTTELVLHGWRPDVHLDDFGGGTTITPPVGDINLDISGNVTIEGLIFID